MTRPSLLGPVLAATLVFAAWTAATASAQEVKLRYSVKVGDVSIYRMAMDGVTTIYVSDQTQQTVLNNEVFLTQRVVAFDDRTNIITFQSKIDSGKMTINGITNPLPMVGQVLETKMLSNGEIISAAAGGAKNLQNMQLVFPDDPVKVGSTWKIDMPPNPQVPVPLAMVYKIIGFEKYKGRQCIRLASSIQSAGESELEGMQLELKASGTIFFDYKRGMMVSNKVQSDMKMILKRVVQGKATSIITRMRMKVNLELQV